MKSRAKLTVVAVSERQPDFPAQGRKQAIEFKAVYDESIPEDRRFNESTETESNMELVITNQALIDQFELGKKYYIDLTPVE